MLITQYGYLYRFAFVRSLLWYKNVLRAFYNMKKILNKLLTKIYIKCTKLQIINIYNLKLERKKMDKGVALCPHLFFFFFFFMVKSS